jgi:hypothetical protein
MGKAHFGVRRAITNFLPHKFLSPQISCPINFARPAARFFEVVGQGRSEAGSRPREGKCCIARPDPIFNPILRRREKHEPGTKEHFLEIEICTLS